MCRMGESWRGIIQGRTIKVLEHRKGSCVIRLDTLSSGTHKLPDRRRSLNGSYIMSQRGCKGEVCAENVRLGNQCNLIFKEFDFRCCMLLSAC